MTGGVEVLDYLMEAAKGKREFKVICRDEAPSLKVRQRNDVRKKNAEGKWHEKLR